MRIKVSNGVALSLINDFVYDFDTGKDVEPFEFNIEFTDTIIEKMRNLEKKEMERFKINK